MIGGSEEIGVGRLLELLSLAFGLAFRSLRGFIMGTTGLGGVRQIIWRGVKMGAAVILGQDSQRLQRTKHRIHQRKGGP